MDILDTVQVFKWYWEYLDQNSVAVRFFNLESGQNVLYVSVLYLWIVRFWILDLLPLFYLLSILNPLSIPHIERAWNSVITNTRLYFITSCKSDVIVMSIALQPSNYRITLNYSNRLFRVGYEQ